MWRQKTANRFLPYKFSLLPGFFVYYQDEASPCEVNFNRATLKKSLETCIA